MGVKHGRQSRSGTLDRELQGNLANVGTIPAAIALKPQDRSLVRRPPGSHRHPRWLVIALTASSLAGKRAAQGPQVPARASPTLQKAGGLSSYKSSGATRP